MHTVGQGSAMANSQAMVRNNYVYCSRSCQDSNSDLRGGMGVGGGWGVCVCVWGGGGVASEPMWASS